MLNACPCAPVSRPFPEQRPAAPVQRAVAGIPAPGAPARLIALTSAFALASCAAVGPDPVRPAPPALGDYTQGPPPGVTAASPGTGGTSQAFVRGDLPAGWYHWFNSPPLNALVARAFDGNVTLAAARARLRRAEALLEAERGLRYPAITASGGVDFQGAGSGFNRGGVTTIPGTGTPGTGTPGTGTPGTGTPGTGTGTAGGDADLFTIYTASATVAYNLDAFGGERRRVQSAAAEVANQQAQLQAAYLTIIGNVVATAFETAALRSQIAAREELVAAQQRRLALIGVQVAEGFIARADLLVAQAEVTALLATIPPLRAQLAAAEHRLAELVGDAPAQGPLPRVTLAGLNLPQAVPLKLPARLVRTRPDVLAAEAQLAAAAYNIGVAEAQLLPDITITGSFGVSVIDIGAELIESTIETIGAALAGPVFQGGRLTAQRRAQVASYQEALANYQQAVLTALREVADGIRALEEDALALQAQTAALYAARESLELAEFQLDEGAISIIDVIVIQQRFQEARLAYITAVAERFQDTAALFAALGAPPLSATGIASVTTGDALDYTDARLDAGVAPPALPRPAGPAGPARP